ncbi:unnamed protein product [Litomosoides sigmodontis]|uniref:RNase NYN domain-containing protein n=1 Tax=Litomosoides sigmodontis TaxID=42156 RepID=A0A3P6SYR7_LITSI|nr:unnamed protein product [Litomosoides sigmodontis]
MSTMVNLQNDQLPLSLIYNSSTNKVVERSQTHLLRPIFINGVEVGFAYAKGANVAKKLNARGITICLWYFISRGHQAQALLPFCFKSYPDKSNHWDELMALYHLNLVEFTPGFGSDKYVEVNRIMATRTRQYGGCMVARSQMHAIVEQNPILDRTVEQKLLMPSFNGNDIIFPIDGPLGRNGCTLAETLICKLDDPEWSRCISQQMSRCDQQIWMTNLANIMNNPHYERIARKVCRHQSITFGVIPYGYPSSEESLLLVRAPRTNLPGSTGFSKLRRRTSQNQFPDDNGYYQRPGYNNAHHFSNRPRNWTSSNSSFNTNQHFIPSYQRNQRKYDEKKVPYIGHPNSIYRLNAPPCNPDSNDSRNAGPGPSYRPKSAEADKRNRFTNICGYSKARPAHYRNSNLIGAKDGVKNQAKQTVRDECGSTKYKEQGQEKNCEDEEKEKKQKYKQDEEEKEAVQKVNAGVSPEEANNQPADGEKNAASVLDDIGKGYSPVPYGASLIKNEMVISSTSDCADLINFSDSDLESEQGLREAEILM